ncbi:hypothetical protein O1R50_02195 [Glycomyces luteolus]|uniref:Uncharacterized protein n=1 Tax=Glycomyces luteolus TaxID=2670330 RepID=A0A9X3P6C5_9ACTN|nr:hypothetical protein [Glycomyces luteolus]MDA1358411.1 hypothetical protein [Glycomyces luteolus]
MDAYALLAIQMFSTEAQSALPDAPVVADRPTLFDRIAGGVTAAKHGYIARELRVRGGSAVFPKRADVRRAA